MSKLVLSPLNGNWSLAKAIQAACLLEAAAPKAGNVHPAASFADMHFGHFVATAISLGRVVAGFELCSANHARYAPPPTNSPFGEDTPRSYARQSVDHAPAPMDRDSVQYRFPCLGQLTYLLTQTMLSAAGCNTSLGSLLLFAPVCKAFERTQENRDHGTPITANDLRHSTITCLQQLTPEDSRMTYDAIRLADAGGMGRQPQDDILGPAPDDLVNAMSHVASFDAVARQYSNGFREIFETLLPWLHKSLHESYDPSDAICRLQLRWLAFQPDGLIHRKLGTTAAQEVQHEAAEVLRRFAACEQMPLYDFSAYQRFDHTLRSESHRRNPGTTADLIAATLLVHLLTTTAQPCTGSEP